MWDVFHADRLELERSLSGEAVRAALARGELYDDDLARPAGTTVPWARLADLPTLLEPPTPPPPPAEPDAEPPPPAHPPPDRRAARPPPAAGAPAEPDAEPPDEPPVEDERPTLTALIDEE